MSDDATTDGCSIAATLAAVGDRGTLLILRDLFRGVRRFERLHQDLGIARNLLTDRLQRLVDLEIVHRVPYQDRPVRHEYHLTTKGADLSPALVALMHWGDRWYAVVRAALRELRSAHKCPQFGCSWHPMALSGCGNYGYDSP